MSDLEMKVNAIARAMTASDSDTYNAAMEELKMLMEPGRSNTAQKELPISSQDDMIEELLLHVGMPQNLDGFYLTARAIAICAEEPKYIKRLTTSLYPKIAKEFDTKATLCERSIRHAIEVACDRADVDVLYSYFGNSIDPGKGKLTNKEFISRMANVVRKKISRCRASA